MYFQNPNPGVGVYIIEQKLPRKYGIIYLVIWKCHHSVIYVYLYQIKDLKTLPTVGVIKNVIQKTNAF